jgi:hypothetical protein
MGEIGIHVKWVLVPVFCGLTGYTPAAVRGKIQTGNWLEGKHYRRAPDGHITINMIEYYKWVETIPS